MQAIRGRGRALGNTLTENVVYECKQFGHADTRIFKVICNERACVKRERHHMAAYSSTARTEGSKARMKECVAPATPLEN